MESSSCVPVCGQGEARPLIHLLCDVDVFLTADGHLLRLSFKMLDVVVDVEHVVVEFGEVVKLKTQITSAHGHERGGASVMLHSITEKHIHLGQ